MSCLFLAAGVSFLHVCMVHLSFVQSFFPSSSVCPTDTSSADICPSILCVQSIPHVPHGHADRQSRQAYTLMLISVLVGAASCLFHMHGCLYCLSPLGSVSCSLPLCLSSLSLEALHHVCPSGRGFFVSSKKPMNNLYCSIVCKIYSMYSTVDATYQIQ
jgi:hypothetical protein